MPGHFPVLHGFAMRNCSHQNCIIHECLFKYIKIQPLEVGGYLHCLLCITTSSLSFIYCLQISTLQYLKVLLSIILKLTMDQMITCKNENRASFWTYIYQMARNTAPNELMSLHVCWVCK